MQRLFLIKEGQRHPLNLFLRRNTSNGANADVPCRFYLRVKRFSGSARIKATHQRTLKHTRQGSQLMVLHLAVPKPGAR
ncbi:hypothetical protein ERD84_01585 [Pollutimonas harenae]|nr:hypothetical protein ERD84_01585 [Pollutimonas harenae]